MLIGLVKLYPLTLSPLLPRCCRFTPSCSQYALRALKLHGPIRGSLLTLSRLARCQPFCKGGFDPVPPRSKKNRRKKMNARERSGFAPAQGQVKN